MAMENEPFEDAFPIENVDFPASYVSLPEGRRFWGVNQHCQGTTSLRSGPRTPSWNLPRRI